MDGDPKEGIKEGIEAEAYLIGSIRAAMENVRRGTNAPFGAVIARHGKVIATAVN